MTLYRVALYGFGMTSHRIEPTAFSVDVVGDQHPALDAITKDYGTYRRKDHRYVFPKSAEARIREALATITDTPASETAAPSTGWSNASRRRAGHSARSHPLGAAVEQGDGYTVYEDTAFGGGRVQIWDES